MIGTGEWARWLENRSLYSTVEVLLSFQSVFTLAWRLEICLGRLDSVQEDGKLVMHKVPGQLVYSYSFRDTHRLHVLWSACLYHSFLLHAFDCYTICYRT